MADRLTVKLPLVWFRDGGLWLGKDHLLRVGWIESADRGYDVGVTLARARLARSWEPDLTAAMRAVEEAVMRALEAEGGGE